MFHLTFAKLHRKHVIHVYTISNGRSNVKIYIYRRFKKCSLYIYIHTYPRGSILCLRSVPFATPRPNIWPSSIPVRYNFYKRMRTHNFVHANDTARVSVRPRNYYSFPARRRAKEAHDPYQDKKFKIENLFKLCIRVDTTTHTMYAYAYQTKRTIYIRLCGAVWHGMAAPEFIFQLYVWQTHL